MVADGAATLVVPVRGLDERAVGEMIRSLGIPAGAGVAGDSEADLVPIMHARTGGNPFFVQEVSRLFAAARHDAGGLPATVREVVNQRVARLPPQAQQVLRAAAVLGRHFGHLPLAALVGC